MLGGDGYIADRIMSERVDEQMRLAANRRMAQQARKSRQERTSVRRSPLSQETYNFLSRLGRRLSALGRQM
jgi:hypothetical protein